MSQPTQRIVYHSLVSCHSTLSVDIEIMRQTGFSGGELNANKIQAFLDAGFSESELRERLAGLDVPGVGFLLDIERHGEDEKALLEDARRLFTVAKKAGAKGVQIITGPVQVQAVMDHEAGRPCSLYKGVLGLPKSEQMTITARNMTKLADMAKEFGLILYLESLGWSPLNSIADQLELINRTDRPNMKMVVDFWHCYVAGDTPDVVAKLDKDLIYGVHVCDSFEYTGGVPNEAILRDVPTGEGVLNLQDWVDAVKSTGYVGWWSPELFCKKQHEDDSFAVAKVLKERLESLILP